MPAPSVATYSAAALVAAQTSFRDLIDSGPGPGLIRIRSAADVLLATITLADPCGTVNGTTGVLTFSIAAGATNATAGTAAYGEICTSAGTVHLALPAQAGTTSVYNALVINNLEILAGSAVDVVAAAIG